ncbi:microtubule-associated protein futsch isoform X1 [Carassius gibelio]|uniref:microtubule-associated protein futsch isoform X1 n=1 Tax=Carassius gibelio TaxID=101364 RepID=UPI0022795D66|nr:microtubule-associated protein futsch isoform X1 [Carassius gibelio]XP_052401173.1 microtubule-associated protein futsch isoform X1 [Carassius gibelio]
MKPDGVATAPSEPMEAEGTEPITEPTSNDGVSQNGTIPSPPQPDEPQNEQVAPPTAKEASGKTDAKSKSKGPVKGKIAAGPATTGPGTRPKATQSRVANGLTKTASSAPTKKPIPSSTAAADKKKPTTTIGSSGPSKKPVGSSTAITTSRAQPKATTAGTNKSTTTTTTTTTTASGQKTGPAASTATSLSKRPATAATSAATKPKTTAPAPRPAAAPAAKPSTSATAKTTAAPKTNRATGSSAPRPGATSSTGRTVTGTTTSSTSAVPRTSRTATKSLITASDARKDAGKTSTMAPAKKIVPSTISRSAASKPSNSEAPKPAAATKRPPPSIKAPQPKPDDKKSVPTRKVPSSSRNNPSRPASGKNIAASPSHKQPGSMVSAKLQPAKPTQSVNGKPNDKEPATKPDDKEPASKPDDKELAAVPDDKEPAAEPVQLLAAAVATVAVATAAAIAREESVSRPEATPTVESSLDVPASSLDVQEMVDVQVTDVSSQSVLDISNTEPEAQEALIDAGSVEVACPTSSVVDQDKQVSGKVDEKLIIEAPVAQEATEQESLSASQLNNAAATIVSSGVEVAEKDERINSDCYEDVEEEEREGSQQVSLSEMSGTQPTEESRPGSAGLGSSVWRAGALLSELDSEDVSCSQQGASELSAPGVLEGTESMDDLGDASLKGADGEGASVGSPDFEKVSDILTNEDDDEDDEDRICDMEVGSERAEDSHRQHHDNEDDDDEDVEMASEGITESGLESYGNADEDDLTEDYRLDNLNRIQPPPMVPSAPPASQWNQPSCFADVWAQPPQPAYTLLSSPSSECWQADPETPTQTPAQASLDVSTERGSPSKLLEPPPCTPQQAPISAAEGNVSPKPGLTHSQTCMFQPDTSSDPDLASDSNRDISLPEEVKDDNLSATNETHSKVELQEEPVNPAPTVLPDIMQDLGIHLECGKKEEEPETLPADDVLGGPATALSSPSSATEDEASDTEGEMQISDPQAELSGTVNAYGTAPAGRNLSTLEECEEMSGENGGGGSETPQSATSAASYGFDYMTSNSNAQSSAESCSKSPGIFSLENEEQLPDEAKDLSLLKELTMLHTTASEEKIDLIKSQHGEFQSHPEQQYMLCGESSELLQPDSARAVPLESGLMDPLSRQHQEEEQELDSQHPYYSTICEKTDSPLAEGNSHFPPQPNDLLSIQMTMSSKLRLRPRAPHVTQPPRLPTDLPPRISNVVSNTQLRCLEQHQQHLHEIQQRQEKRDRDQARQEEEEKQARNEREQQEEEQKINLLELQLKQQEQERKQRQQIMQWQQELEQQQQQKHKVHTPVVLSPSCGLTTIYETVETSDEEEEGQVVEELEDNSSFIACPGEENYSDDLYSQCTTPSPESVIQGPQRELQETDPAADQDSPSPLGSPEGPPHLEFDWGKKVDIVQQLIKQSLLLAGDGCSPLLLLPGGAGGTLSPLESSLWPNMLPPLTPPSATVTSVSSFSPEAPGSSAQGEWTVVELETHH